PLLVTLAFYRAARRLGVRFISGEGVVAVKKHGGRARYVVTENSVYEGETVLVIAGYGSRAILKTVGLDVPMTPVKMECLVTEETPPMFYQMLGTAMADFYGHQSTHGSFVFGGQAGYEAFTPGYEEPPYSGSVAAGATCRGIMGYFPALKNLKVVRAWAGWLDDCADHVPVVSAVPEVPGLIIGCAFSGHGFGISPVAGLLLAELASGEKPTLDVSAFRYDRFVSKQ
ncbi:MAG: FAD-binding oxidoreductase, partial [Oscillospiraceae bacterium]|nr:FAD-binding oxidoreductase [Oscillospiraceae bacterium]